MISGKNHMAPPEQLGFEQHSDSKPSGAENGSSICANALAISRSSVGSHRTTRIIRTRSTTRLRSLTRAASMCRQCSSTVQARDRSWPVLPRGRSHRSFRWGVARTLDELDQTQNTFLVYCSDNGRPFPRCKTYLYDSGIRTPLIVAGPGVAQGRSESLVSSVDFAATILELAGIEKPNSIQGVSFAEVLADPAAMTRDVAFAERNWHVFHNHERAVRTGDWLYIWNAYPERHNVSRESAWFRFSGREGTVGRCGCGTTAPAQALLTKAPQPAEMLFNVKEDPHQFVNLADDAEHRETLERMRKLLARWKKKPATAFPCIPRPIAVRCTRAATERPFAATSPERHACLDDQCSRANTTRRFMLSFDSHYFRFRTLRRRHLRQLCADWAWC